MKIDDLLPDINEYLETANNNNTVSAKGLEEVVLRVCSKTGLNKDICTTIVSMFFHEIRNTVLRGDTVTIRGLGKWYMSSPRFSKNKKRVFPKFKPYKKLLKRMNDSRS